MYATGAIECNCFKPRLLLEAATRKRAVGIKAVISAQAECLLLAEFGSYTSERLELTLGIFIDGG